MRGTMVTGGLVLLVLLAGIALLVSRQVVLPVRSASRIAERFAEGHLSERMPVRGEDDMARLAVSFNDMAESLQRQITQLEEFGNLATPVHLRRQPRVAHPLTTVRMAADLIHDHAEELDPSLRRSTELMVNELDRFETLLNDLLEISRHDAVWPNCRSKRWIFARRSRAPWVTSGIWPTTPESSCRSNCLSRRSSPRSTRAASTDSAQPDRQRQSTRAERKPVRIRMAADEDTVAVTVATSASGCGGRGEAGVQPVLAIRPVAGATLRRNRAWSGDQHRGRHDCTRAGWRRGRANPARAPASG